MNTSRQLALLALCSLAAAACLDDAEVGSLAAIDDPTATCADAPAPGPITELSFRVGVFDFGPCGELAWIDEDVDAGTAGLYLAASAGSQVERLTTDHATSLRFGPAGERLAYGVLGSDLGFGEVRVHHLGEVAVDAVYRMDQLGPYGLFGADGLWTCDGEALSLRDPGGDKLLSEAVYCNEVQATADGATLLYANRDATLGYADLDRGESGALAVDHQPSVASWERRDVAVLSPDGRVAVRQVVDHQPCGDTFCLEHRGEATVHDLRTGKQLTSAPARLRGPDDGTYQEGRAPAFAAGGHVVLIDDGYQRMTALTEDLAARRFDGLAAVHAFGDQRTALVEGPDADDGFRQLSLLDLDGGAVTPLVSRPEHVVLSASEERLAVGHFTSDCVLWPDQHACHTQIWALSASRRGAGVTEIARASQPVEPLWIADDGTVLASGRFYRDPPPGVAPAGTPDPAWRLVLFAPDGRWLADLGDDDVLQLHPADGALLLVRRRANHELVAVNTSTGTARALAEGRNFAVTVDASGLRVAFAYRSLSATGRTLKSGAVPRP